MNRKISAIYHRLPPDLPERLDRALSEGLSARTEPAVFWFRADDIGIPGKAFFQLIRLFEIYRTPLALAVVPVWLTPDRWDPVRGRIDSGEDLFCWYQHGYRHRNHEISGKKQEFGPARPPEALRRDLARGKHRLETILGSRFFPAFTPPWNRCGEDCLRLLRDLGYQTVSRDMGATPKTPAGFMETPVNLDIHTRKDPDPETGWKTLFSELKEATAAGWVGVMIHHQRMNRRAFDFLELFLSVISRYPKIRRTGLRELVSRERP